jgi:hypothetical protein
VVSSRSMGDAGVNRGLPESNTHEHISGHRSVETTLPDNDDVIMGVGS